MHVAAATRTYSLQSIAVIFFIVVVGYLLIRRRADKGRKDTGAGRRPLGTAPPPGAGADRWERPPSTPPPNRGAEPPGDKNGDGDAEEPPHRG